MALAHVQVLPSTAVNGQSTEFTVHVPAEGGLTTTSVRVDFPSQVSVSAVADAPRWTSLLIKHPPTGGCAACSGAGAASRRATTWTSPCWVHRMR